MKRFFAWILVCLLLCSGISAVADIDLDSMSAEELLALIEAAEARLAELQPEATSDDILYADDNIKITLNGDLYIEYGILTIPVIVENYIDRNLIIGINDTSCNGWDILEGAISVNALKKAKTEIYFFDAVEAADLESADDVQEISCTIRYFDEDTWDYTVESDGLLTWNF